MSESMEQVHFSAKSFLVIVRDKGLGYRAPIIAYSDKALAWAHFLEMVSKYPGDKSMLQLLICGEFDPFSDKPITIYDEFIEIDSDVACESDLFDHYLIDSVNKYLTHNENSLYGIALKDPEDSAAVLSDILRDQLREKLKRGVENGEG